MNKKQAFTLAEILICLTIIGCLAAVMISSIKTKSFDEKAQVAALYKAIEVIDEASANMVANEPNSFPMSTFITNATSGRSFAVYNGNNLADVNYIFDLYKRYIKFEATDGFCKYTDYCSGATVGGKIAGDIAIGFEKYSALQDCPAVYVPESGTKVTKYTFNAKTKKNEVEKCWGRVFFDTNGKKVPNKEGSDVFIYGLGTMGLVR